MKFLLLHGDQLVDTDGANSVKQSDVWIRVDQVASLEKYFLRGEDDSVHTVIRMMNGTSYTVEGSAEVLLYMMSGSEGCPVYSPKEWAEGHHKFAEGSGKASWEALGELEKEFGGLR